MELDCYAMLASSIAGRTLRIAASTKGTLAYTDGHTIFLSPAGGELDRLSICIQAALLTAGSLDRSLLRRLLGRPSIALRYLALEVPRSIVSLHDFVPRLVHDAVLPFASAAQIDSPQAALELAFSSALVPPPPTWFGTILPRQLLRAGAVDTALAHPSKSDLRARGDIPQELDENAESEVSKILKLLSSPLAANGWLAALLNTLAGGGRDSGENGSAANAATRGRRAVDSVSAKAIVAPASVLLPAAVDKVPASTQWRYPEWDEYRNAYRADWCGVVEWTPAPEHLAPLARTPRHDQLRRHLARLGMGMERQRRQSSGADFDLDALVELRIAQRCGDAPRETIYIDQQRTRRDLGVLVLLDISGSSKEQGALGKSIHAHQTAAAAALVDTLEVLGDRVACYAFQSRGRENVHLIRVKSFDEKLVGLASLRLGGLVPGAYTRMGAAIRHGSEILRKRAGTPRQLLIILSDGFAFDEGYEARYGAADTRKALAEARATGVACLSLSIGGSGNSDELKRVFGSAAHAASAQFDDLVVPLYTLFLNALKSIDLRRRYPQPSPAGASL